MSISPAPQFPERSPQNYERKGADNATRRGPLRFEEGVATDTDVPNDFIVGMESGAATAPGRPNRNAPVWQKSAAETLSERAHVGSAAWVEAPASLTDFATGGFADYGDNKIERVMRSGAHQNSANPAVVND
jgi:hypothetical protein